MLTFPSPPSHHSPTPSATTMIATVFTIMDWVELYHDFCSTFAITTDSDFIAILMMDQSTLKNQLEKWVVDKMEKEFFYLLSQHYQLIDNKSIWHEWVNDNHLLNLHFYHQRDPTFRPIEPTHYVPN